MSKRTQLQFKYGGENFIDINTLLTSQFHFITSINEFQREFYPNAKIKIRVAPYDKGSFIVNLFFETTWIKDLFSNSAIDISTKLMELLTAYLVLKALLKGEKAISETKLQEGRVIVTNAEGQSIEFDGKLIDFYKSNRNIHEATNKNFELLEEDVDIDGISIMDKEHEVEILNIPREDFNAYVGPNSYFDRKSDEQTYYNQVLYIKKPNLFPEPKKAYNWGFIYRGRDITAKISDEDFRAQVNAGLRVGQGDRLMVDLKIFYRFDKQVMTFIETNKFEILKINSVEPRVEHPTIDFEEFDEPEI